MNLLYNFTKYSDKDLPKIGSFNRGYTSEKRIKIVENNIKNMQQKLIFDYFGRLFYIFKDGFRTATDIFSLYPRCIQLPEMVFESVFPKIRNWKLDIMSKNFNFELEVKKIFLDCRNSAVEVVNNFFKDFNVVVEDIKSIKDNGEIFYKKLQEYNFKTELFNLVIEDPKNNQTQSSVRQEKNKSELFYSHVAFGNPNQKSFSEEIQKIKKELEERRSVEILGDYNAENENNKNIKELEERLSHLKNDLNRLEKSIEFIF